MNKRERVVLRLSDGSVLKGYLNGFSPRADEVVLADAVTSETHHVDIAKMKAIFFVRSFEGDENHREKKAYGITKTRGNRVYIKFKDGESLVGFLEGEVPWEKGFFLSGSGGDGKGFFLLPVDEDANNRKVFVVASSVADVTVVP
jgi:small nuclear ribonucleoprotein (snRNP)-like protein